MKKKEVSWGMFLEIERSRVQISSGPFIFIHVPVLALRAKISPASWSITSPASAGRSDLDIL